MNDEEKQLHHEVAQKLLSEEHFVAAVIGGAIAAVIAAFAFSFIVARWPFAYGFAVAGIGVAIGVTMGFLGRGVSMKFAIVAAIYTIAGCILGRVAPPLFSLFRANVNSPGDAAQQYSFADLLTQSISGLTVVDLVYWLVAVFCAVFFSRRALSRSERLAIGLEARQ